VKISLFLLLYFTKIKYNCTFAISLKTVRNYPVLVLKIKYVIHKFSLMKNIQFLKSSFLNPSVLFLSVLALSFTAGVHASILKNNLLTVDIQSNQMLSTVPQDTVYSFVDKMPEFPGGEKEVIKFLSKTMLYPEEAQKKGDHGKVIVQFVITKTGKVEKAKVLKGVSPELDNEALRVIGLLPDWNPGELNGEKVNVYRIIPILFQNVSPEDAWEVTDKTMVLIDNVKMPVSFNPAILNFDKFASVVVLKPFPETEKSKLMSKYGKAAENGVLLLTSNKSDIKYSLPDSTLNTIKKNSAGCKEDATLPLFPGGDEKLLSYIEDSIQYPFVARRTKTEGKVLIQFMVDTNGKVSNATVVRAVDYFLNKEAVRVVNSLPAWTPGAQCGTKINFIITVPVVFKLDLPKTEKSEWVRNKKTIVLLDGVRLPDTFQLEWLQYENLASYQVLQPTSKEITKKLKSQYGHDAEYGVIVITSHK